MMLYMRKVYERRVGGAREWVVNLIYMGGVGERQKGGEE